MDLSVLRQAWDLPPILSTWMPDTGTIHRTLLLKTTEKQYALREYRYAINEQWRIAYEHALIVFVHTRDLPVLVPWPLPDGETIFEHNGRFYALFPFARGKQIIRGQATTEDAYAMGLFLAQLHQILRDYPQKRVYQRPLEVDLAATLAAMNAIEIAIRSRLDLNDEDAQALSRLNERRVWLTIMSSEHIDHLSSLERQVIHGDYQETNLFFENGQVSAVIDWDQSYAAPRAWEVVRTLHYTFRLEARLCRAFLEAYHRILPLSSTDIDVVAAAYGWMRAHDTWQFEEFYLRGNQRIRPFLQLNEPFRPFIEQWANLRPFLM